MARSRYRSVTYHLEASVELARAVYRTGGRTDMASLAAALSYSGVRNGAFLTRLANARLFGLVAGRSGEVVLLDLGRRCLSADQTEAHEARQEACLSVPLFRYVLALYTDKVLPEPGVLADTLQTRFGETPNRAMSSARVLIESAGQAGLLSPLGVVLPQFNGLSTDFTDSHSAPGPGFIPPVGSSRGPLFTRARERRTGRGGPVMVDLSSDGSRGTNDREGSGLWLDEGGDGSAPSRSGWRRSWVAVGAAACLVVVGIPVGLLATTGSPSRPRHLPPPSKVAIRLGRGPAERSVLAALSATTDSGSFAFTYDLSESPGAGVSTTTTTTCGPQFAGSVPVSCGVSSGPQDTAVQGSGIINTNPMAMAASAAISQSAVSGLMVGVRVDPTTVWEVGDTDNGLTPQSSDGSAGGQSLPEFAGVTEGALGTGEGAVAMMGMASPTGYLDLVQPAITGAAEVGSSTVDGVAVTQYELAVDPASLASAPGVSSAESSTITSAIGVLTSEGFTTIRDLVSIDASGFIRESSSTVSFSDGGTVTLDAHFSNFGCACTLLMPGQGGVSTPPPNCTTTDTGVARATSTTTTAVTPTTTTSTISTSTTSTSSTPGAPRLTTTTTTTATAGH